MASAKKRRRTESAAAGKTVTSIPEAFRQAVTERVVKGTVSTIGFNFRGVISLRPRLVFSVTPDGEGGLFMTRNLVAVIYHVSASGTVSVFVGKDGEYGDHDGTGPEVRFGRYIYVLFDKQRGIIWISDYDNSKIKKVDVKTYEVTTVAGGRGGDRDAIGTAARLCGPGSPALSDDGMTLYFPDCENNRIKCMNTVTFNVVTVAGDGEAGYRDGGSAIARFRSPVSVCFYGGVLYVFDDLQYSKIRMIDLATRTRTVTTLPFSGLPIDDIAVTSSTIYVTMQDHTICAVDRTTKSVTTFAGSGEKGHADGVGRAAQFSNPCSLCFSPEDNSLIVGEYHCIRKIMLATSPLDVELEIPPSTFGQDMEKLFEADEDHPSGKVTFIVGKERKRFENVFKNMICVRCEFFSRLFRAGTRERTAAEVPIPDASPEAFHTLLKYLITDKVEFDSLQQILDTATLAKMYLVPRLVSICLARAEQELRNDTVVPLLENAHVMNDTRLLMHCRRFMLREGKAGGVGQLQDLGIAKGLLNDAYSEINVLRAENDRQNRMDKRLRKLLIRLERRIEVLEQRA